MRARNCFRIRNILNRFPVITGCTIVCADHCCTALYCTSPGLDSTAVNVVHDDDHGERCVPPPDPHDVARSVDGGVGEGGRGGQRT